MSNTDRDPWKGLAALTPARIALGRTGASLPTRAVLEFSLAHARARDAVHAVFDADTLHREISGLGLAVVDVVSEATERAHYLRRPDHGRRLAESSRELLMGMSGPRYDLAIVVGDGLSAAAVQAHALPLLKAVLPQLAAKGVALAPVCVARGARVALADEIGELLQAKVVAMLIGERPGLSSPDSLGVYVTFAPRRGRTDAERNCISNIRTEGLNYEVAAFKLSWLVNEALSRGLTGVALKDESESAAVVAPTASKELT